MQGKKFGYISNHDKFSKYAKCLMSLQSTKSAEIYNIKLGNVWLHLSYMSNVSRRADLQVSPV